MPTWSIRVNTDIADEFSEVTTVIVHGGHDGDVSGIPEQGGTGMGAKENLAIVRSGYEAFGRGDIPAVLAVFSPDIQWHIAGRSSMAGTYKGHEEVVGFFTQLGERTG